MMDFSTLGWIVGVVAALALVLYVFWMIARVWKDRLMRCPETGAITLVGIEPAARQDGQAPAVAVQRCGLWPEKRQCTQGCLARYRETSSGYKVKLSALRPFKPR